MVSILIVNSIFFLYPEIIMDFIKNDAILIIKELLKECDNNKTKLMALELLINISKNSETKEFFDNDEVVGLLYMFNSSKFNHQVSSKLFTISF